MNRFVVKEQHRLPQRPELIQYSVFLNQCYLCCFNTKEEAETLAQELNTTVYEFVVSKALVA